MTASLLQLQEPGRIYHREIASVSFRGWNSKHKRGWVLTNDEDIKCKSAEYLLRLQPLCQICLLSISSRAHSPQQCLEEPEIWYTDIEIHSTCNRSISFSSSCVKEAHQLACRTCACSTPISFLAPYSRRGQRPIYFQEKPPT